MLSRFERFSFTIAAMHRYLIKIASDEMVKYGLKGSYAFYLAALHRYSDGITAAQLCEKCDKDKAAVSRAVAEMERRGLILRETNGDNLYRALLKLTDEGKKAADFICERAALAVETAGDGLSDNDRKIFYEALDLIAGNLQIISRNGLPADSSNPNDAQNN